MRAVILLFICISVHQLFAGDSLKVKNEKIVLFLSYNIGIGDANVSKTQKYSEEQNYEYERMPYVFKTPCIGIGYAQYRKRMFYKIDFGYSYTVKKIEKEYYSTALTDQGTISSNYLDARSIYFSPGSYPKGTHFYKCHDKVIANLNANYIDINFVFGPKIVKNCFLLAGLRSNMIFGYAYRGRIERRASEFVITGMSTPSSINDSLIGEHNILFESKADLNQKITQTIKSNFYWSLGTEFKLRVFKSWFLIDLMYDLNLPRKSYARRDYATIKLSYVF